MKRRLQKAGIILSILLVILATGYFAGTWYLKQKNEDTKQTTAQADGQKAEADKEQEAGARSDLQTEYDTILEKCQKEFISNRPIDENFLAWFHSKYGDETLKKVADEVEKENQDQELWYIAEISDISRNCWRISMTKNVREKRRCLILPETSICRRDGLRPYLWIDSQMAFMIVSHPI